MSFAIHAEHLRKTYPTKPPVEALTDFNLSIESGGALGLLGPNGAGKTTFIRILLGIILPTEGSITVMGVNPSTHPHQVARNVRFVPETPYLNPRWTLWENARYWFTLWDEPWNRESVANVFEQFDLLNRAKEPVKRYSRGMQQRAGLALAFGSAAKIMVLDEPTLGLDVLGVQEVLSVLNIFKTKGKTILFASHDMRFVEELADHIALIANGRVLEVSSATNFRQKHGRERLKLRYRLPDNAQEFTEEIPIPPGVSSEEIITQKVRSIFERGGILLELKKELPSLESVVTSFLRTAR